MGRNWTRRSIEEIFDDLFKKYGKKESFTGNVGIPYIFRQTGAVSIGDLSATFWLTPTLEYTPSSQKLTLLGQDIYWNNVQAASSERISMFSFERRVNTPLSSLVTALDRLRYFAAGSGNSDFDYNPFADCFFIIPNGTQSGHDAYKVEFTASVHNIFEFTLDNVDCTSVDVSLYRVPVYKLLSNSTSNFSDLYSALDSQGLVPADKIVKFMFFHNGSFLSDDEFKNICNTLWGINILSLQTVTV